VRYYVANDDDIVLIKIGFDLTAHELQMQSMMHRRKIFDGDGGEGDDDEAMAGSFGAQDYFVRLWCRVR
jgi:hypothetical protein